MECSKAQLTQHDASFRDPSGFIFYYEDKILRQVNESYQLHYDHLMQSGLYTFLTKKHHLIAHAEIDLEPMPSGAYKILAPTPLFFISYPQEWCFSQLKDAALKTLEIQEIALQYGMSIKDASAYNIQFQHGKPIFIDTLSFECYQEGKPWEAYRQFCQHFLAPLALMAEKDIRLGQLLKVYLDGIPLQLASNLLSKSSWLHSGLLMHIHLHAKMEQTFAISDSVKNKKKFAKSELRKTGLVGILHSLRNTIKKLKWNPKGTEWADYYISTNYSDSAFQEKKRIISNYLQFIKPQTLWDLGANTGHFSRLALELGVENVLAFDIDPAAVERNYQELKTKKEESLLPLQLDLTNPTPSIGWHNKERDSLLARGPADCLMALALVHHLAISHNVPFERIAHFFADLGRNIIVEFVPKTDSQVLRLLQSRKDIFDHYNKEAFEKAFSIHFAIKCIDAVGGSERSLYYMEKRKKDLEL